MNEQTPEHVQSEEIADATCFLLSEGASYMCRSALVVDGGYTAACNYGRG